MKVNRIKADNVQDITCPYCKGFASLQDSAVIYGSSKGPMYICNGYPRCDSYVGAHKISQKPLGTLANKELRYYRVEAHKEFDELWKCSTRKRGRSLAYKQLSIHLGIGVTDCHIGYFDIATCKKVIEYAKKKG